MTVPKQPVEGNILIDIRPERVLSKGDTDTSGAVPVAEKFKVYVNIRLFVYSHRNDNFIFKIPKPVLVPNYGPSAGGTKIRIQNLAFDTNLNVFSNMKVFLGKQQCHIIEYVGFSPWVKDKSN